MAYDDLLQIIPIDQIARQLGVDRASAEAAVQQAVPSLLAGMQHNVQDASGEQSLLGALGQHVDTLAQGGFGLEAVDVDDGAKIVRHVFGAEPEVAAASLAGRGGSGQGGTGQGDNLQHAAQLGGQGGDLLAKVLPILAPIVMSYLANSVFSRGSGGTGGSSGSAQGPQLPGGGLGDLLGGILGGAGGGLGDLLGGMFGGRR